jgi:CO/xanthine dehydrogenase Mo-binding subunit
MFGLPQENVRVVSKFLGSGFGSKLWPRTHCPLAVAAARQLGRPVKVVVNRKMMFQTVGIVPERNSVCGWARPRTASSSRSNTITSSTRQSSMIIPADATVQLRDDGRVRVACGTQDIGTGTYTNLAQIASQKTGVPLDKIEAVQGDTLLPPGPISGGSLATASVVPAVLAAADNAIASLLNIATSTPGSPFQNRQRDDLNFENGKIFVKADGPGSGVPFADIRRRANLSVKKGQEAARIASLKVLAAAKQHLGTLDRLKKLVKLTVLMATILDAGHFALDEQADEVIRLTEAFMQKLRGQ